MPSVLEPIAFDAATFRRELAAFKSLLDPRTDLSERRDIQPFFKARKHVTAYIGALTLGVSVATELCFEFDLTDDFRADVLLGSRGVNQFCVVEFEEGAAGAIFKKQRRKHPEWSARFDHAVSQIVDWFYNLEDQKNSVGPQATFGTGEVSFSALLVMGRKHDLTEADKRRLAWRTKKVLIDSNTVKCLTFDDLYADLEERFAFYAIAAETTEAPPS